MTPLLLLLACSGGDDPALEPFEAALAAYDEGAAALAAGKPEDAAARFAAAREKDPRSIPLRLWEAKALADAGRLADADARLTEIVEGDASVGMAWYNRAAYRARAGRMDDAAADLRRALELKARSPLEAADDPDFAAARAHPAFAGLLPAQPLEARAKGADGAVFVGSRYPVEITIAALPTAALAVAREGADPGCLRLGRILQDDHVEAGKVTRVLTLDLRAEGPCDAVLGPFVVSAGGARTALAPLPVKVEAPPGAAPASGLPPLPTELPVPGSLAAPDAGFAAKRVGDGVVAMGSPDRTLTGNGARPDVALEWRVDGQTRAIGGWWRTTAPVALAADGWSETVP